MKLFRGQTVYKSSAGAENGPNFVRIFRNVNSNHDAFLVIFDGSLIKTRARE